MLYTIISFIFHSFYYDPNKCGLFCIKLYLEAVELEYWKTGILGLQCLDSLVKGVTNH